VKPELTSEVLFQATVTMFNWQQYRHVSPPGWKLGWSWANKEIIWTMLGAETILQGDCAQYRTDPLPHCCAPTPVVVDLLPDVEDSLRVANCCKGGVLQAFAQDPAQALAVLQITVGNSGNTNKTVALPHNFTLLSPGPGYTCGPAVHVPKSLFPSADGRRWTEALSEFWNR
jgi:hypothetical protein